MQIGSKLIQGLLHLDFLAMRERNDQKIAWMSQAQGSDIGGLYLNFLGPCSESYSFTVVAPLLVSRLLRKGVSHSPSE